MNSIPDRVSLMSVKDLSIAARTVLDGFMNGINKSFIKGSGLEFSQYRSYQPGDDLRWLDWKMYARSDRYYIRESEVETNISIRLLIDASGSMNHEDENISKIQYARVLAASLAYLAQLQGDACGLYVFKDGEMVNLPAKKDFQHLARIFHQLENILPGGKFTSAENYKNIYTSSQKRELLIFITDLYQQGHEMIKLLDTLNALGNEVIVFHLMGKNEMEMNFKGFSVLEDMETGKTIKLDGQKAKAEYLEKLNLHLGNIKTQMLDRNIQYRLVSMDELPYAALRDYLNQRNKSRS